MKAKLGYLMILVLTGFLYLWTNVAVTFYLFFGLLLFAAVSWGLNWWTARHIGLRLVLQGENSDTDEIQICVKNTSIFPCFRIRITGNILNCLTDSRMSFSREMAVAPKREKKSEIRVQSLYCGRIEVEIEELRVCDFLGVFERPIKLQESAANYIYPREPEKNGYETEDSAPALQNAENRYLRRKGNDITEILDLRNYQKGDSIKTIHWKLSKKMGHKVVRELDTPANQEIIVLFALSEENKKKPECRDLLVQVLSRITRELLENGKMFDAVIFEKEGLTHSEFNIEEIYTRDLYERTILDGNISFDAEIVADYMAHYNVLHKYSSVILITDEELADWYPECLNVWQIVAAS